MATKNKTFTYWRARFSPEPNSKTMQELLEGTFPKLDVSERAFKSSDDSAYVYFINHTSSVNGFFCASFFCYEKDKINHVIKELSDQKEIVPEALPPIAPDGEKREYLDGKLFMACFKDHMILVQDQAVRGKHLERYLYQKLLQFASEFKRETQLGLERSLSRQKRKKISGVKRVNIKSPLEYQSVKVGGDGNEKETLKTTLTGSAWESLKTFLGDKVDFKKFDTDGIIDPKDIEFAISLTWKNRKRNETESDELDALTNAISHIDDEAEIEIETLNGKYKHNELRLEISKSVSHNQDMPDHGDIFDKMILWYNELNAASEI